MLSFSPRDVLDEIWDLIESVSEGFPTYSLIMLFMIITHSTVSIWSSYNRLVGYHSYNSMGLAGTSP